MAKVNLETWGGKTLTISSLDQVTETNLAGQQGLFELDLAGNKHLFVYATHDLTSADRFLPIFFNGAVTTRENKTGPFFSGLGIAKELSLPSLLIADPTIDLDSSINLAWYSGSKNNPHLIETIAAFLDTLAERLGVTPILIGGSGGGFAALAINASMKKTAKAFVWNPQTDFLRYVPQFVHRYLEIGWGRNSEANIDPAEMKSFVEGLDLKSSLEEYGVPTNELLVVQNSSDWHSQGHAAPLIRFYHMDSTVDGVFSSKPNQLVVFGDWGDGHIPPPAEVITKTISMLCQGGASLNEVAFKLFPTSMPNTRPFPRDLRQLTNVGSLLAPIVERSSGIDVVSFTETPDNSIFENLIFRVDFKDAAGTSHRAWGRNSYQIPLGRTGTTDVTLLIQDTFRHDLATLNLN